MQILESKQPSVMLWMFSMHGCLFSNLTGEFFVQIYCGVFMNNVLGLTSFLTIVYIRDVEWDITAEILVVLIICSGIGLSSSFSSIFPFWTCLVAYALYPISLGFLYVLTISLGWG